MRMLSRGYKESLHLLVVIMVGWSFVYGYTSVQLERWNERYEQAAAEVQRLEAEQIQLQHQLARQQHRLEAYQQELQEQRRLKQSLLSSAPVTFDEHDIDAILCNEPSAWHKADMSAYVADCVEGCSGITATGIDVRDTRYHYGIVAVDPRVIPLYSIIEIEGYGYYKALDKGGAIKGHKIDILMSTTEQALTFGRQQRSFRFVRRGGVL